ncbi:uncharacterized protein LOC118196013 [Stegodyphus dumicola]|uniref:uncharacterized protein LOC118196013 n=1 Tax=Stegodyphus dumicola TaxID=202533 RepID=UPI0015B1D61F|nr:uncharacterized protein LOC118196013 [Stegodyphus dumicola]
MRSKVAKDLLSVIITDREAKEERIAIEKYKVDCQDRYSNRSTTPERGENGKERSVEELTRTIRLLTVKVPSKADGWDYFFSSLERAYVNESVPDEYKAKILIYLLGDKAANLLTLISEDKYGNYEEIKETVLKEFKPSPQVCLENFRKARRSSEETFGQFSTRVTAMWENYVKSRGVTDFEGLNQLVVADKIYQTLDTETAVHIGIRQGDSWFKPRELGKECDIFFAAKGKSYNVRREACETKILNQAVASASHFKRHCPQIKGSRQYNRNEEKDKARVNWVKKDQDNDILEDKVVVARVDPLRKSGDVNDYKLCELKRVPISVNGTIGKALVDSGTEITVVKKELTKSLQLKEGSSIYLKGIFGPAVKCPLVSIPLSITVGESANVTHQEILCAVAESLAEDVLLPPEVFTMLGGRLYDTGEGVENLPEETTNIPEVRRKEKSVKVNTGKLEGNASMGRNLNEKGKVESSESQEPQPGRLCTADVFRREQETCESLVGAWENAQKGKGNYYTVDNFLFHKDKILGESVGQLVVPKSRREEVLQLAHCSVFSGHMGVKKTVERIRYSFYWEGLRLDVQKFCEACKECQLTRPIKTVDRTPITPVTRPDLPFQIVNIDVIGPIDPPSSKGHKYILCLVDQHTRWAEAIPLTSLSAKSTYLTQEFERRIGASPKFSTPGYPQANGLVERFNGTLKRMFHHVIREEGRRFVNLW